MKQQEFDIISLVANSQRYYPASSKLESWMKGHYIPHNEIEIPLGASRIGGPIIDLPTSIKHPSNMEFTAQLDLNEISKYDKLNLLPSSGQLFFFSNTFADKGIVIYSDVPNKSLKRHIKEHENNFWDGYLIASIVAEKEHLSNRYSNRFVRENDKSQYLNNKGQAWDYFAGSNQNKIYGVMTHCQFEREFVLDYLYSDNVLLLQIGENGFNDDGVLTVMINRNDLEERKFENCEFYWGQS